MPAPTLIDIGINLVHDSYDHDRAEVIAAAKAAGVTRMIVTGSSLEVSRRAIALSRQWPGTLWCTAGVHPHHAGEFDEAGVPVLEALAREPEVVAVGECGLDYFRSQDPAMKQKQESLFREHIRLAQEVGKPLMIHARPSKGSMDAYEEVLNILESISEAPKANFHFFVGDIAIAKRILALGGTMSFDGPITFTNEYDSVIAALPLSAMMAETDAPFAAPEPYRSANKTVRTDGKTMPALCEPWMVKEVVTRIALLKNADLETVRLAMIENAKQFFKILL